MMRVCIYVNVSVIILIEIFHMLFLCCNLLDFSLDFPLLVILFVLMSCLELVWYEWQQCDDMC